MKYSIPYFVVALALCHALSAEAAKRPNILFIVADDLGYADVGFQGCRDIPTPNLDSLAAGGVRFSSGYVSGPYCSPTRAGLMTGRYQTRFGHEFNTQDNTGLPVTETTIADRLRAAGYVTGLVGKWHLGSLPQFHPQKRGFDDFFGFLGGAHDYFRSAGILRGTTPVKDLDYTTDAFAREAIAFIDRASQRSPQHGAGPDAKPWFLYLAFNAVHTPMQATDDRLAKFPNIDNKRRRTYDAMTLALDEAVGKVLQRLAELKLEKDTLVLFISDNGGPTMPGTTINGSRNAPLRGSKRTTLEGGIRVPYVLSWPGNLKPGVYKQPVIQLDASVTALAVAGVEPQPAWQLDGVNLIPFLTDPAAAAPHEALYWRFGNQMAIRAGDFKLVRYDTNADTLTGKRKQKVTPVRLYNLSEDIGESKDLAAAMPERVKGLQARWDAWNATLVKPLWNSDSTDDDGAEPGAPATERARGTRPLEPPLRKAGKS